jgi:hypothetical protein
MSTCEKCWRDSRREENYKEVLDSRKDHPCTPEEQAGPDASECPLCKRKVCHQHTGECMTGCKPKDKDA